MNKQFYLILAFMLLGVFIAKATIHTVSNDPNQPARWNNLQTACDSAVAGDTIYITGTATNYCTGLPSSQLHIKKRLHLIGAGIKPVNNILYGYPSTVSTIVMDSVNYISGASGTVIEGLSISGVGFSNYSANGMINNLIFRRNRFASYWHLQYADKVTLVNNIITNIELSTSSNVLLMNNIILTTISNASSSTIISNNLFVCNNGQAFSTCVNTTITNNIFYYSNVTGATYSTFSNNIGYGISTTVLQGSNTGNGNLNSQPLFLYEYSTTDHSFNDLNKYKLKSNSPGKNAGTDGTDMGIYGGQYPWPPSAINDYIHCITPMIPVVQELVIQNSSVPANGNLNFSVKAYKTSK